MLVRCDPTDKCDKRDKSDSISGFQYFQSEVCGYNSCLSSVAHYHCQKCGYGTSELSHTSVHRESCSRVVGSHFSQSPCLPISSNSQGSEYTFSTSYDSGSEPNMSTLSTSSVPPTMSISNSSNHLYYRGGSQQSSMFNPLLSSQSQSLYSGVFGSQVGFSSQNNFPPSFNSFSHVEPPPWLSDTRLSTSANSTPTLDVARNKTLSCNSQGISHSCCGSRVGGLLENMGLCSPLAADSYKSLNKETTSCQHKSAISMENQNWFCGQSMLGYSSQVSGQGIQNTMYKCSEPFPSCTMSQLGIPLNEQDLKHSSVCYDSNPISKQSNSYHCVRKSNCLELSNKDSCSKYTNSQKLGQISEHNSMQSKELEHSAFDGQPVFGPVDGDLHDEIYSQTSTVVAANDDRNTYSHVTKNALLSQPVLCDSSKSVSAAHQSQATAVFSRCNLPTCDTLEGYLQLEGQPLYQYPQVAPATLGLDEDQVSNPGSCSAAGESDIVVEESEDEVLECEISVEDLKEDSQTRCFVCSSSCTCFVHVSAIAPVTSTSHIPIVTKLSQVMPLECNSSFTLHTEVICHRCLNLIDTLDSLESKLSSLKQNLIELYSGRNLLMSETETCKKNDSDSGKSNDSRESECISSERVNESIANDNTEKEKSSPKEELNVIVEDDIKITENDTKVPSEFDKNDDDDTDHDVHESMDEQVQESSEGECMVVSVEIFTCTVCSRTFSLKEHLIKHSQQHEKSYNYFCDRCGRGFMQSGSLEKHLATHSQEHRYQCEVCGKCYTQKSALEDHLRKHRGAFRHICSYCNKGFLYASSLQIHERIHTGERPYMCQHCGKSFICVSNLTSHLQLCKGDMEFSCKQCGQTFLSSVKLKSHIVTSHETRLRHNCEVCGKVFAKPCDLKVHYRVHSGEKPHQCKVCGKLYSSIGNLNQHAKKHSEERPFKCDVCGKGFLRKTVLERHKNQHSGDRPYKCSRCDKAFASAHNLHAHTKLHTGTMKKYTCTVCGKIMNHGLKVHMRTHSGDKPYSCTECGSSFSVKSSLDKHIKLKHERIT